MGKVCPSCKRQQPKAAYRESGGKVNAKKRGKAACNDCKAAGGDCVKLSAAGFILVGIPDDHENAYYNGVYTKSEQIVQSRHVYYGQHGVFCDFDGENTPNFRWQLGEIADNGTVGYGAVVSSLAASPETISNECVWKVVERQENEMALVSKPGITTTVLTAEALATASLAANNAFDEAIEQAAPSFVLSGLDSNHLQADMMGVYEREDERERVKGRFVYKGPNDHWAWSVLCGHGWSFGVEEDIGQSTSLFLPGFIVVGSSAPAPESIVTKRWRVIDADSDPPPSMMQWQVAKLTTTAINYRPAKLFQGTCTYCAQCREWRRCGKGGISDKMYCSDACQRAHLQ